MALYECENYCSNMKKCWGCANRCNTSCKWAAISECVDMEAWQSSNETNLSQKPGILK